MKIDWIDKLRFFLHTLAFCLVISAIQFAFQPERAYEIPLVYSIFIGTCIWALMDFGRHLFPSAAERGWPQGFGGLALPLSTIPIGYVLGTLLGDSWFGWSSWDNQSAGQLRVSVLITAMAGSAATYYFFNKSRGAYLQAQMAKANQQAAEAHNQAAEARLKLLETQIEPHMLFNTLANLRALISTDTNAALHMLDRMNDYLRATLKASRATLHPLQTEFDRLGDYLALMAIRMGPRLQVTLDLPPELATLSVPPLLLQPLVENSIKHGLEPKVEGGSITVRARYADKVLTLEVLDTGVGMAATNHGPASITEPDSGFGLAQVRERLLTVYGPTATINVIANYPTGTGTTITFPHEFSQKCPPQP
jgi:signal transduction histidine kinase